MARRILCSVVLLALLAGLSSLYRSDRRLFRKPEARVQSAKAALANRLAGEQIALLLNTDEAPLADAVSGNPVRIAGTRAVPGRYGRALGFDGRRRTFVTLPVEWDDLGPAFTLSCWINLDARSPDQELWFTRTPQPLGLKLDRGQLSFFVPSNRAYDAVSFAFTNYGHFVHIAAVVDAGAGQVRLYEQGRLRAEGACEPFALPATRMLVGTSSDILIGEPIHGAVDEVVAWRRRLSDAEIAGLADARQPALQALAPRELARYRRARRRQQFISHALKLVDRFNPALHAGRLRLAPIPEVNLVLSKDDADHFMREHKRCLASGRRVGGAANPRRITVIENRHGFPAHLRLLGDDKSYPRSPRRSYLLDLPEGETVMGLRRVHLQPPESAGWLGPLLETRVANELGIPAISNGMCRLVINGELAGLYYYEDAATLGVPPGQGSRRFHGEPAPSYWTRLAANRPPRMARDTLDRLRAETEAAWRDLLLRDAKSPLSSREIRHLLREETSRLAKWPLDEQPLSNRAEEAALRLTSWSVLGANPSPYFILHDLQWPALPPGVAVEWSSSRPDLIDGAGRVTRPETANPIGVTLTARVNDGTNSAQAELLMRVMPRARPLGAFFLWAADPLNRLQRVDCAVAYYPEGDDQPRRWLAAQQDRAGIALRGNTSLRQPKKSFSVRLETPHGLWGSTNQVKIRLVNPWRDPTFAHNRFFYSLFAAMGDESPDTHRGMPVTWVEVFLNGHYYGLYEASPSVREEWLGLDAFDPEDPEPAVVYKAQRTAISKAGNPDYMMRQIEPSRTHGHLAEPILDLHRFIEESTPAEFAAGIGDRLDLDNAMDFHLLLNFSENYNGSPFNYTIHDILVRRAGPDQRFFLVPYDFDNTYGLLREPRYHSHVFSRLLREVPGYRQQLAARWRALRAGPMREDALMGTLREIESRLAGYVAWDDDRWQHHQDWPYAERMDRLEGHVQRRLAELDRMFGPPPPPL